jgi:hypothetical protein
MDKRAKEQLRRIKASIERLTHGTPLQGADVQHHPSKNDGRLSFKVTSTHGDLIDTYAGVLISALENWTDESLDQRLYDSCVPGFGGFLNIPGRTTEGINVELPKRLRISDCTICAELSRDLRVQVASLREITRAGATISKDCNLESVDKFLTQLHQHLKIREEIQRLYVELEVHRKLRHGLE